MKTFFITLAIGLALLVSPDIPAQQTAWIMSIPHALSDEHVYKVRILSIDGQPHSEVFRYAVEPGTHRLEVELMLDVEWEPDLTTGSRLPAVKYFELQVEAGRSYQLAAAVDIHAPAESQLDQSFWQVIVYRKNP